MPAVPIVAAPARLEARGICKQFPGVRALEDVSLRLEAGEVLAVIGENGAGKSTLMRILAGVLPADRGELWIEGKRAFVRSVQDATAAGIALIHQELNLCDNLDVAANLYLGRESRRGPFLNRRRQRGQAAAVLESLGLATAPETLVGTLSVGMRQMVEIAKALSTEARILIMDEPTSSLTHREAERLFALIDQLRRRGVSVIYISHRLSEVQQVADRVEVLRDGRSAGGLTRQAISHAAMVRLMVGRDLVVEPRAARGPPRDVALEARQLRTAAFPLHPLQFQIRGGEIVGMGGLVGAGRTELLTTLFGLVPAAGGDVLVAGERVPPGDCAAAIAAGMALVPEDRKATGAVLDFSIRENVSLGGLRRWTRWRIGLDHVRERRLAEDSVRRLAIRAPSIEQPVRLLSGGNQQKVVLGKWLACRPQLLLMDEPTRGVDVGAKQEIYRLMRKLAEEGAAVLFASSDMEELLHVSERLLVMHQGRITGALEREAFSEQAVMRLATGWSEEAA